MTPEVQAAVEQVTRRLFGPNSLSSNINNSDLRTILAALSEANERASILQTALHERTTERDEARKALAASEARRGEAYRLGFEASGEGWNGEYPFEGVNLETSPSEHALAWRKGRAGDLNPQQEGSRDHG